MSQHTSNGRSNRRSGSVKALTLSALVILFAQPAAAATGDPWQPQWTAYIVLGCLALIQLLFIIGITIAIRNLVTQCHIGKNSNGKSTATNAAGLPFLLVTTSGYFDDPSLILLVVLNIILFGIFISMLRTLQKLIAVVQGKTEEEETDFITQISESLTRAIPIEREEEVMMDHSYDGIRELDNVLPPWWVYMFYGTIIWGAVYIFYYHISGEGDLSAVEYEKEIAAAQIEVDAYKSKMANLVDETNVEALTDAASLERGKTIFQTNCITCHGSVGQGTGMAPNLTDTYWKHGGGIKNVFKTIRHGVPEKGMISWESQLSAANIHEVASYVWSLQGSNPPDAKAPEGDPWSEQDVVQDAPADTTAVPSDTTNTAQVQTETPQTNTP
ncbi:MAG: c-type cytochrome [Flavobacteriales bacterium]|nr:c-type cytochrome [Flavobacteriales bacterium]